jgi:hypothetical protein
MGEMDTTLCKTASRIKVFMGPNAIRLSAFAKWHRRVVHQASKQPLARLRLQAEEAGFILEQMVKLLNGGVTVWHGGVQDYV